MIKVIENGGENGIKWCKIKIYSENLETYYKGLDEAREKAIELLGEVTGSWLSGDKTYVSEGVYIAADNEYTFVNTLNITER
jgi:hypothetical protein